MRILRSILLAFSICFVASQSVAAPRTGSFDTAIAFQDTTRLISCYVPTKYSDTIKYRLMVCLHGLGDNSKNYRNALLSLNWKTYFPNTIFVCPEAQTTSADFLDGEGGDSIIQRCIDLAMSTYHIDTSNVVLQGFSLGGRAALRYGLDHYSQFRALLLNTPAIQGVKNALNEQAAYTYTYANASKIPIYITHGMNDPLYEAPIDSALKQMILANGKVRYANVSGLAHSIPAFAQMPGLLRFIDTTASMPGVVLEITNIDVPALNCSAKGSFIVRNIGSVASPIVVDTETVYGRTYTGNNIPSLAPFEHAVMPLNNLVPLDSTQRAIVTVTVPYGNTVRDTFMGVSLYAAGGQPVDEGFEGAFPPAGWALQPAGDYYSAWSIDNTIAKSGKQSIGTFNTILIFDNLGRGDAIVTPPVDLHNGNPTLSFDLAYNYHRYTPPYFTDTVDFADTLEISLLIGCDTSVTLFRKAGAELATFPEPILNPLNLQSDFIQPDETNWRHYVLDLSPYASAHSTTIKFNYISGLGGSIYLDNIALGKEVMAVREEPTVSGVMVYPNPAADRVSVVAASASPISVEMLDISGRTVATASSSTGETTIDTHELPTGMYLLRISSRNVIQTKKLQLLH